MKKTHKLMLLICVIFVVILFGLTLNRQENLSPDDNKALVDPLTLPEQKVRIAFLGDSGIGPNFLKVLNLIKSEQADAVVHLGDFDYTKDPNGFNAKISSVLGEDYPYLVVPGNHDNPVWKSNCTNPNGCYAKVFAQRYALADIPLSMEQLDSEMYQLNYKGIDLFFVGSKTAHSAEEYSAYLSNTLPTSKQLWKVCNWHKNQTNMQVGGKQNEMGWLAYDICLSYGAIIATAHEHSYQRTKTLVGLHEENGIVVNPTYNDPNHLKVYNGSSFAFVSGLGGKSIRNQERCLPSEYPYGCKQEWAKIYTSNQRAKYGVLFMEFNPNGDPNKATGYFKNIENEVVDAFTVTKLEDSTTPAPPVSSQTPIPVNTRRPTSRPSATPTPSPTTPGNTNTPRPTATPPVSGNVCGKSDVDGDGRFKINDFQAFAQAYGMGNNSCADTDVDYGPCGGKDANGDGVLDIVDFGGAGIGFAQRYYPKTSCSL